MLLQDWKQIGFLEGCKERQSSGGSGSGRSADYRKFVV